MDYQRFLEKVGTSITKKGHLVELLIKMNRCCMDGIRERKDWWKICEMLQKSIGRRMMKLRRPPLIPPAYYNNI